MMGLLNKLFKDNFDKMIFVVMCFLVELVVMLVNLLLDFFLLVLVKIFLMDVN